MNYSTSSGGPGGQYRNLNNVPIQQYHPQQQHQQSQQNFQHIMQQHHHHHHQQLQQNQGQLPMRSTMPHHQLSRGTSGTSGIMGGVGGGPMPTSSNTSRTNSIPQPALMALNSILTLGPFKHRKDLTRESVLSTYQIMDILQRELMESL